MLTFSFFVHLPTISNYPFLQLTYAVLIGFTVCANVVLLNLLIGLMTTTMTRIHDDAQRIWRLQWAQLLLELERQYGTVPLHRRLVPYALFDAIGKLLSCAMCGPTSRQAEGAAKAKGSASAAKGKGKAAGSGSTAAGQAKKHAAAIAGAGSSAAPAPKATKSLALNIFTEEPRFKRERDKAALAMKQILDLMDSDGSAFEITGYEKNGRPISTWKGDTDTSRVQAAYHPYLNKLEGRKARAAERVKAANAAAVRQRLSPGQAGAGSGGSPPRDSPGRRGVGQLQEEEGEDGDASSGEEDGDGMGRWGVRLEERECKICREKNRCPLEIDGSVSRRPKTS